MQTFLHCKSLYAKGDGVCLRWLSPTSSYSEAIFLLHPSSLSLYNYVTHIMHIRLLRDIRWGVF